MPTLEFCECMQLAISLNTEDIIITILISESLDNDCVDNLSILLSGCLHMIGLLCAKNEITQRHKT